jgi:cell division septation protein DedD
MTALFEEDLELHDPVEVHWGASTILAIFFAASLISAVFFGLGYSFGGAGTTRHSVAVASADTSSSSTESVVPQTPPTHAAALSKPAVIAKAAGSASANPADGARSTPPVEVHQVAAARLDVPMIERQATPASSAMHENAAIGGKSSARIMVQVGAIGSRKDAERLVAQLRKKGFYAGIYSEKRDKFLHVQIGPFKDAQQAQSKRHQVMASGFHAILKSAS